MLLGACSFQPFQLRDGKVVECKDFLIEQCGVSLYECRGKEEYHCMHEVKKLDRDKVYVLSQRKALNI